MGDGVTRVQRAWVYALLLLLLVPGVIGFDAWPLTGWRLFSLSRDADQNEWMLEAITPAGLEVVDLEQLPLAYRNAAWPLDHSLRAGDARRAEICAALLEGVREAIPDATGLMVVRVARHMTDDGPIDRDAEEWASCG
jgi:hypothetical protein